MMRLLFINYIFKEDFHGMAIWFVVVGIMALLPVIASFFDLRYGILKSKKMGTFRTRSSGLARTINKDKGYLAFYFMFALIDACLSFFVAWPVLCVICAIAEVGIELWSVHENFIEAKATGHDPLEVAAMIAKIYGADKLPELGELLSNKEVLDKIKEANNDNKGTEE